MGPFPRVPRRREEGGGKISWPGRDEVVGTTAVVLVYTVIVGTFLFLIDAAVTPLVNKLFAAFGS